MSNVRLISNKTRFDLFKISVQIHGRSDVEQGVQRPTCCNLNRRMLGAAHKRDRLFFAAVQVVERMHKLHEVTGEPSCSAINESLIACMPRGRSEELCERREDVISFPA